jgi:hypothetical protein
LKAERCPYHPFQRKSPRCRFPAPLSHLQRLLLVAVASALLLKMATAMPGITPPVKQLLQRTSPACSHCVKSSQLFRALFHANLSLASSCPRRLHPTLSSCAPSTPVSRLSSSTLQPCQVHPIITDFRLSLNAFSFAQGCCPRHPAQYSPPSYPPPLPTGATWISGLVRSFRRLLVKQAQLPLKPQLSLQCTGWGPQSSARTSSTACQNILIAFLNRKSRRGKIAG